MTTYYHVTWYDWDGEDLKCFRARLKDGVEWHWGDADWGREGDIVSLFEDLESAIEFRDTYCRNGFYFRDTWCPPGEILSVDLPDDDDELARLGIVVRRNSEGYPAIPARIPAELITRVRA